MDFTKLYKENVESVRKVCLSYLKNPEDVEDATQDTFLNASQHLHSFNDDSSVGTWLISIAKNVCSDKLKQRKKDNKLYHSAVQSDGTELWSESYQDISTPEAILSAEEEGDKLVDAFAFLPEKTKQAMLLRFDEELSYKKIAEHLGVPVGTAKIWVHRGRIHLLDAISPQ